MARFFSDNYSKNDFSVYLLFILLLAIIPPLLIMQQPDLGTAIAYLSIILPILYWSNARLYVMFFIISPIFSIFATYQLWVFYLWMFLFLIVVAISRPRTFIAVFNFLLNISCAISAPYIWNNFLEPHQQKRILTFLNPMLDPLGSGYQVIQSMISIGSGGFWGKGLGEGTQTGLKFLPVADSDFIISVTAEEMGFKAIFLIIIFISVFIYWSVNYSCKIENKYVSTLIIGYATLIYAHMIINLGMISGLLPVTGLPAPFISYGGSFFLTCSIILGIINNAINNNL
jgi:rod shape determining protein RodA